MVSGFNDPLTNRNAKAPYNPPSDGHDDCVLPGDNMWCSTEYDNYWSQKARMKNFVEIHPVPLEFGLPGMAGGNSRHRLSKLALGLWHRDSAAL